MGGIFYKFKYHLDKIRHVLYDLVMISNQVTARVYTHEQVAQMLQLSKNTVYELIGRGEIVAKRIGKVYRIPASSISFVFTGFDHDLHLAEKEDLKELTHVQEEIAKARARL